MPEPVVEPQGGHKHGPLAEIIQPAGEVGPVSPSVYTMDPSRDPRYC